MSWVLYVQLIVSKYMFHRQYLEFINVNRDFYKWDKDDHQMFAIFLFCNTLVDSLAVSTCTHPVPYLRVALHVSKSDGISLLSSTSNGHSHQERRRKIC